MKLRQAMQAVGRAARGSTYELDPLLTSSDLVSIASRRAHEVLRGWRRGLGRPWHPGSWVFLGKGVVLKHRRLLRVEGGVAIGRFVVIDSLSRDGVHIGAHTTIGDYTQILATGVIANIGSGFRIGRGSSLGAFSSVGAAGGVTIGDNVIMGQGVSFHSENHNFDQLDLRIRDQGVTQDGIVIESDCWIGANVTFLDGAYVESGCVVGAGAVVRGRLPTNSVAVGNPARVIRLRGEHH